jgi:hypothetical protein
MSYANTIIEAVKTALEAITPASGDNTASNVVLRRERRSKLKHEGKRAGHIVGWTRNYKTFDGGGNSELLVSLTIQIDSYLQYSDDIGYSKDEQEDDMAMDVQLALAGIESSVNCTFESVVSTPFSEEDEDDPVSGIMTVLTVSYLVERSDFSNAGVL